MATNPLYVPLFTIEEVILNKATGLPLAGGVVNFYRDLQRLQPKEVYQISGTPPDYNYNSVGAELTLGLNGSFVDGAGNPFVPYAYPYDADGAVDLYYVTVESSGGTAQFTREAVPYLDASSDPASRSNTENELSNPQFVEVLFPTPGAVTLSVTGSGTVTPIAPGWDLVTTGTGTVTLQRLEPTSVSIDTNPPYTLSIEASAALGASVTLRQRLNNSPSLMRGEYVSGFVLARIISGGASSITMTYAPSAGTATTIIDGESIINDGAYHGIFGNQSIAQQVNTAASTGYIDINIVIPTSRTIAISSIQVVGLSYAANMPFDEQSADRQRDHLFHFYEDATVHQQKDNLVTGWVFGQNPWQFYLTTHGNVATNQYTADQTIMIQQAYVTSAAGNNVAVTRGTSAQNHVYKVASVTATNQFGLLQYIDPSIVRNYWGKNLSARVRASIVTSNDTELTFKLKLLYKSGLPATVSQTNPVATWASNGSPSAFASGWTELLCLNDPEYTLSSATEMAFDFNQFTLPASDNDSMTLAVLFYTTNNMDETGTADYVLISEISLIPNDFAMDSPAKSTVLIQKECEFYYEKSYAPFVMPGTVTNAGYISYAAPWVSIGGSASLARKQFGLTYKTLKRSTPTVNFYSPTSATINQVLYQLLRTGAADQNAVVATSTLTETGASVNGLVMTPNTTGEISVRNPLSREDEGRVLFHYVADSRMGV